MKYPILVQLGNFSGYVITYPDFPELKSYTKNIGEVTKVAEEDLCAWAKKMVDRGKTLPEPTDYKIVDKQKPRGNTVLFVSIPDTPKTKATKKTIAVVFKVTLHSSGSEELSPERIEDLVSDLDYTIRESVDSDGKVMVWDTELCRWTEDLSIL